MKYKNIIWDYDGTLFDTYPAISLAFSDALLYIGIHEPIEEIIKLMKISIRTAVSFYDEKYGLSLSFHNDFKERRKNNEELYSRPFNGAVELCGSIYKNGGRNFIFTHRDKSTDYFLEKYSLLSFFTETVTSANNFAYKPNPEGIIYLMDKYNLNSKETVMIGDRQIDIDSGINAKIATCFFMDGEQPCPSADFNFNTYAEINHFLLES